jgi:tetratricopeptide (TPR) repeat protein
MNLAFLTALAALAATPTDDARREAQSRFGYAVLLAGRNLPAQALKQLEVAAKLDPESLEVARDRLRLYAVFGRHADATRTARAILDRDPDDATTAQTLARIAHEGKNDAEAVRVLRALLGRPGLAKASLRRYGALRDLAVVAAADPVVREAALRGLVALMTDDAALLVGSPFFDAPAELAAALAARREQLADALVASKKFPEAEAIYRDLKTAFGPSRLAWNLSGVALAQERYPDALKLLTATAPADGRDGEFYDRLAELTRRTGSDAEAVRSLKAAAAGRPKSARVWWVYASELGRQDSAAGARLFRELAETTADAAFFDRYVRFHRTAGRVRELLDAADLLANKVAPVGKDDAPLPVADDDDHTAGVARYRALVRAIKADAELPVPLVREAAAGFAGRHPLTRDLIVWLAERVGRPDLLDPVLSAAARSGDRRGALLFLASLERQRKWQDCLELCDELEGRAGRDDRLIWKLQRVTPLVELGRGPEALRVLGEAERAAALPLSVRLSKAHVLTQIDRPQDALKLLAGISTESADPDTVRRAKLRQAEAHLALRDTAAADALYEQLLDGEETANVSEVLVLNNYAYNLADQGRKLPQAEAMLRRAIELDGDEARRAGRPEVARGTYLDSLGWVLFRRGKLTEARAAFERAMASDDGAGDPIVWDHAGDVYARLGEATLARAAWTTALKLSENTHQGRQLGRRDELKAKLGQLP